MPVIAEEPLSARDMMILGAFDPTATSSYRQIVEACQSAFHPTPHELIRLRKLGFLQNHQYGRGRRKWYLTNKGIELVEVAGGG